MHSTAPRPPFRAARSPSWRPVRAAIVIVCYGLSFLGFLVMLIGLGGALNTPGLVKLLPLLWLFAWGCHGAMSLAWVRDRILPPPWPIWGRAAGVASLLSPLLFMATSNEVSPWDALGSALTMTALMSLLFLPAIVLAIHLVRFHTDAAS